MSLSNTATPKYYGMFRDAVIRGEIPVNEKISMEMNVSPRQVSNLADRVKRKINRIK